MSAFFVPAETKKGVSIKSASTDLLTPLFFCLLSLIVVQLLH